MALIASLSLNLHGGRITESIERLNSLIFVALLIAVGLRIAKKKSLLTAILIVVADIILIGLTFDTITVDSLWDTLKNFVVEPAITLTIICIVLLAWDWTKRAEKINL